MMCRVLSVPRSSYYAWVNRPKSSQQQRREVVGEAVEAIYYHFKKRYGAPRIQLELNDRGIECSLNFIADILRNKGLKARNGKGFQYYPRIESQTHVSDNLLRRNFDAPEPNMKWVSDITYIKVGRIWLYLAVVMDLFSRKIIGWALDRHMRDSLIIDAFNMALSQRDLKEKALIHSDRGVQYRSNDYQATLAASGIRCSMSRKGNCWDNAAMESFFSRFKVELIYAENYHSVEEAKTGIFEYIEIFYNRERRHSAIGYVSPHEYEMKFQQRNVSTFCG